MARTRTPSSTAAEHLAGLNHEGVRALFDHMPDVQFWIKDRDCRYVHANQIFLDIYHLPGVDALVGKRDHDLSAAYLADQYLKDDRLVMTGKKVINRIELNSLADGTVGWFITTKMPLRDRKGSLVGTTGFTRNVSATEASIWPYQEMASVVAFIRDNIGRTITVRELAKHANLSVSAFERRFKKHFQVTPIQYIKKVRVHLACQALIRKGASISQIAIDCGFCDHSYMAKEFKRLVGTTPKAFRDQYLGRVES